MFETQVSAGITDMSLDLHDKAYQLASSFFSFEGLPRASRHFPECNFSNFRALNWLRSGRSQHRVSVVDGKFPSGKKAWRLPEVSVWPTCPRFSLPVLHVGNPNKQVYLPLEFLVLKRQACPQSKRLKDDETAAMIRRVLEYLRILTEICRLVSCSFL